MGDRLRPSVLAAFLGARGVLPALAAASRLLARQRPQALPIQLLTINRVQPGTNFMRVLELTIALVLLRPAVAGAEYKRVELKILGMDCAICAHGVKVAVQKVDGVESVELSLERAQADIHLRKDNRVSLDRFRRIVTGNGFEPRQATVTAIGTVREVGGKLAFDVSGVTPPLIVAPDTSAPVAYQQLKNAMNGKSTAVFEVVGTVERKGDVETIAIASVKESR